MSATILVVDDNSENRALALATLEDEGYRVVLSESGEAGIRAFATEKPDCVLLDLTLPRLSGFDVLRHMAMRQPEMLRATIILTAATDESLQFIDGNAVAGVLRKPFSPDQVLELVDRVAR